MNMAKKKPESVEYIELEYARQVSMGSETLRTNRALTEDELAKSREVLTKEIIELEALKESLREIQAQFKEDMKPHIEAITNHISLQRTKQEEGVWDVYLVPDHENGIMQYVNIVNGAVIDVRRLRPDEKQTNIFEHKKQEGAR